uniref:TRUD domain-containing protein n=1 Tax=Setaria digitata TaxID=48799 RepID=A0A915PK78_9BILA
MCRNIYQYQIQAHQFISAYVDKMEEDFFITEYINRKRNKLKCTIKKLYSDFIVNEITPDGTVLDITSSSAAETTVESKAVKKSDAKVNDIAAPEAVTVELASKIDVLLKDETGFVEIPTEGMDKQERTLIHEWIRARYNGFLDSQTVSNAIRVVIPDKRNRKRRTWPASRPDYVHFTLCKENKDTHYALSVISRFLGVKSSSFGICGTKDRRALTTQRVSLYRCEIKRLRELNSKLRGIWLTDFTTSSEPCKLGDLWGNRFKIILRDVQPFNEADLISRIEDFKLNGFINYFGTQRFGSCASNTAGIGIAILKKQWEVALKEILKPRSAHGSIREALDEWNRSSNASAALKKFMGSQAYATIEGQLLSSLSKNKYNYRAALLKLARNTRSLYVHAYQSLLWNKIATRRVKSKGIHAIAGDLNIHGHKIKDFENEEVAFPLISGSVQLPDNEGYSDPRAKLQTDLEGNTNAESTGTGDLRAIALEFSLPSGSYATVALREITRSDMSKMAQISTAKDEDDFTAAV